MSHGNIAEVIEEFLEERKNPQPRIYTGFRSIDDALEGLRPEEYILISGDTGGFKTTLATNVAMSCAMQDIPFAMINYEMSSLSLFKRILCSQVGENLRTVESNILSPDLNTRINQKIDDLVNRNIYLLDNVSSKIDDLERQMVQLANKGVQVFVIDYLQLLSAHGGARHEQLEEISHSLMSFQRRYKKIVFGLAQLSGAHKHGKTKAKMHDVKGSTAFTQDATRMLLVYKKNYDFLQRTPGIYIPKYTEVLISIEKNRHGVSGTEEKAIVVPSHYKFINIDENDTIDIDKCKEFGCMKCNGDILKAHGHRIFADTFKCADSSCEMLYNVRCSFCNDTGIVYYDKTLKGIPYQYAGLCAECPRGMAIHKEVNSTNSIVESDVDKISCLPFVNKTCYDLNFNNYTYHKSEQLDADI